MFWTSKEKIVIRNKPEYIPITEGRFKNLVCLITGGSGSIGSAIAERLLREGAIVVLLGRNIEKLKNTCAVFREKKLTCDFTVMDVTSDESVSNAFDEIGKKYHVIDVLINNAGFSARTEKKLLHFQDLDTIDKLLATNLRGSILTSRAVISYMKNSTCGRIIHIASIVATNGKKCHAEYGAAKAGLLGLMKSQAIEVAQYGITVNCVSPGLVPRDDATDEKLCAFSKTNVLGRIGTPQDIANACAFLASSEASFITGQNLIVDGGRSLGLLGD